MPPALASAASHELGIRTLNNLLSVSPEPYSKSILSVAKVVVEAINATTQIDEDLGRLRTRVVDIAVACSKAISRKSDAGAVLYVDDLIRRFEELAGAIYKLGKPNRVQKMFRQASRSISVKAAEQDLEQSVSIFSMRLQLRNLSLSDLVDRSDTAKSEMETSIARRQEDEITLIKRMVEENSFKPGRRRAVSQSLPSAPNIFFGRDSTVDQVIQLFNQHSQAFVAILGPGGIGKTSVALASLHHHTTCFLFREHRYFIPCDSMSDKEGLIHALSGLFNLDGPRPLDRFRKLLKVMNCRILLCFDNLESAWEPESSRKGVEEILKHLSDMTGVSLLVTLRGAERPRDIPWSRPFIRPLETLKLSDAKEVFRSISRSTVDEAVLDKLLETVDKLPLAVTLLGAQAQTTGCEELLRLWLERKTSMISSGSSNARLTSLDVSIQLSLNSERMTGVPEAFHLLHVLSYLPDGIAQTELPSILPESFNAAACIYVLLQVSLARADANGHIRVLSPVREYVKTKTDMEAWLLAPAVTYYASLTQSLSDSFYRPQRGNIIMKVSRIIGNIHSILHRALTEPSLNTQAIIASTQLTLYHDSMSPGSINVLLSESLKQARAKRLPALEARCLTALAHFSGEKVAKSILCQAIEILKSTNDVGELARTTLRYSKCLARNTEISLSLEKARQAVALASQCNDICTQAMALQRVAHQLLMHDRVPEAMATAKDGLALINETEYPFISYSCYDTLSRCANQRCLLTEASDYDFKSLTMEGIEVGRPLVQVYNNLGDNLYIQSRLSEAEDLFTRSYNIAASCDDKYRMGMQQMSLGAVALARRNFEEAATRIHLALQTLMEINSSGDQAVAIGLIGTIELCQYNFITAQSHLLLTLKLFRNLGLSNHAGLCATLIAMADSILQVDCDTDALSYTILNAAISGKSSNRLGVAQSIQRVGDYYYMQPGYLDTAKACYQCVLNLIQYLGVRRHIGDCLLRLALVESSVTRRAKFLKRAIEFFQKAEDNFHEEICTSLLQISDSMQPGECQPLPLATHIMYQ